ncbi:hypothetical protein Acy02nite_07550 [Actinoplanes cyaneus]|uniref:Uncharacterized protein n=1 Tax=Actinoplanes cyaneus TaxID=52696 RepID=A0A919IBS7_9ACTN|nr:hypothetical protein [Actinoplanes cyaneus]MCW2135763.1 hypothetical protein [Actinoplanes cyaneus]GID62874.1 hypothetical protein Acy02nite_07550 [Actinoplanes cyaneus]
MPGSARTITGSSVIVYLAVSLRSRLRAHAAATGRSHTQIVFDALNDTHPRLAELAGTPMPVDGLFVAQRSGRRQHLEDQVQVSIRPNQENLAVIDGLAGRHTDGNRSALIAAALDAYLPVPMKGLPV